MKKTRFYIVRHGESEGNVDLKKTDYDPPLTILGVKQAKKRQRDLQAVLFDHAYSSHLTRAVQTTKWLVVKREIIHTIIEALEERKYGTFFSHPELNRINEEIFQREAELTLEEWWDYTHPEVIGMESYTSVIKRYLKQLYIIAHNHQNQTVLLVSHGDLMRSLLVFSNYGTHKEVSWEAVKNTGYIIVDIEKNSIPDIIHTVDIVKTTVL